MQGHKFCAPDFFWLGSLEELAAKCSAWTGIFVESLSAKVWKLHIFFFVHPGALHHRRGVTTFRQ